MAIIIQGGTVLLPDREMLGDVVIENNRITAILPISHNPVEGALQDHSAEMIIDATNKYVLPGLIDIHCDAIEKEVQPRPNTLFPLQMALVEFERKLPLHGITTMYHSLSLGVGLSLRGEHLLTEMIELIQRYRSQRSVVRNRIHLRYEVSSLSGLPIVQNYVQNGIIDYLSFMDHSPGQGQYRAEGSFQRYVMKNQGVDIYEVEQIVQELNERRAQVDWQQLKQLASTAATNGIAVASHDDDTPDRATDSYHLGSTVSEFPITLDTAAYAKSLGMNVCVGAPNVVRGGSHDKNMRAVDAIAEGAANILCSDYHPASLLTAVFMLAQQNVLPLYEAVKLATVNAAQALGTAAEVGSIEVGKLADVIVVDQFETHPWVTHAIVDGKLVYRAANRC